jgi:hypothetical protein
MIIRRKIICSFYYCSVFVEVTTKWRLWETYFKFALLRDRWSVSGFSVWYLAWRDSGAHVRSVSELLFTSQQWKRYVMSKPCCLSLVLELRFAHQDFCRCNVNQSCFSFLTLSLLMSYIYIQGVSKRALHLWKLIEIYTEDIHNVLNCQNVAKHTEFYLG